MKIQIILCSLLFNTGLLVAQNNNVELQSLTSLYLQLYHDEFVVGSATGFVIESKTNRSYLITNYHVLTGRGTDGRQITNVPPTSVRIFYRSRENLSNIIPLNEIIKNEDRSNRYIDFTVNGKLVDVVALPLENINDQIRIIPLDYNRNTEDIRLRPSDILQVVGFPASLRGASYTPIWKSGSIASEPELSPDDLPIIYIDLQGIGGMSGAPVYYGSNDITSREGVRQFFSNTQFYFVGIFSSGFPEPEIGFLWKSDFLAGVFDQLD